jgi:glucose 1-dehydrogenase
MNIVITGSTRGIGFAAARQLLRKGHAVTLCSEDEADVTTALASLEQEGLTARGLRCDISVDADIEALLNFAREDDREIDAWINNAGMPGVTGRTDELPTDYLRRVIAVNIQGTCLGSVYALRAFHAQGHGRLLNVIGRGASSPVPFANAYGPSKTWIRTFTRAIARELRGTNVAAATFQPGLVHTQLTLEMTVVKGHEHRTRLLPTTQRYLANSPAFAGHCMARTISGPLRNGKAYRVPFVRRSLRRLISPPASIEVATHVIEPETDRR